MLRFRLPALSTDPATEPPRSADRLDLRRLLTQLFSPGNFYVGNGLQATWRLGGIETVPWEIFGGRLLDARLTRQERTFETWAIDAAAGPGLPAGPLIAARLDHESGRVFVTRAIYSYVWEGYHAGDNVYLSREVERWVHELVGFVDPAGTADDLHDELNALLFSAVVGASRLPLTSLESPLPAFSLGQFGYFRQHVPGPDPARTPTELIEQGLTDILSWNEVVKLLELVLRSIQVEQVPALAKRFVGRWRELGHSDERLIALLRSLFNDTALSPYTGFVTVALGFVSALVEQGTLTLGDQIDFLCYLLRQLGRHLGAYDLVRFHHQGANYPDALLLDAVLQELSALIEQHPGFFLDGSADEPPSSRAKRLRRRGLRQGWLLRHAYRGLPVPEAPVSPGESARVLPPFFERVPEEQISNIATRPKRLFETVTSKISGAVESVLRQSVADLVLASELRELGTAVFLDRPLGRLKEPGVPDGTILLSYEAFSRTLAEARLALLTDLQLLEPQTREDLRDRLAQLDVTGIAVPPPLRLGPPRIVSLDDVWKVAGDFVLLRSTRRCVDEFTRVFDVAGACAACGLEEERPRLIVGSAREAGVLELYDEQARKRMELEVVGSDFASRAGLEFPREGLAVRRVWQAVGVALAERTLARGEVVLRPGLRLSESTQ